MVHSHLKTPLSLLAILFYSFSLWFLEAPSPNTARAKMLFDHDHTLFDGVLKKHVENGSVDYQALLKDRTDFDRYLSKIANVKREDINGWTRQQKLAFWINAYNALTIDMVLRHYPIDKPDPTTPYPLGSIQNIEGVWDQLGWKIAGGNISLNYIEHEVLRKQLKEPRIHFAIVCATRGCPTLENRSFKADTVEKRFEQATRNYINHDHKIKIDVEKKIVYLSMVYHWFGEDFLPFSDTPLFTGRSPKEKGALNFIYRYVPTGQKKFLENNNFTVEFIPYDFGLNEKESD